MGVCHINDKSKFIEFTDVNKLVEFEACYYDTECVIGDVSKWSPQMRNRLLKMLEAHPNISVYMSDDLQDPVLMSRFTSFSKVRKVNYGGEEESNVYGIHRRYAKLIY